MMETNTEGIEECGKPCAADAECGDCADYWHRMIQEGYWEKDRGRWTDKGWKEITKR